MDVEQSGFLWSTGWRCVNCGNIVDPVILRNQTRATSPRSGRPPAPGGYSGACLKKGVGRAPSADAVLMVAPLYTALCAGLLKRFAPTAELKEMTGPLMRQGRMLTRK